MGDRIDWAGSPDCLLACFQLRNKELINFEGKSIGNIGIAVTNQNLALNRKSSDDKSGLAVEPVLTT